MVGGRASLSRLATTALVALILGVLVAGLAAGCAKQQPPKPSGVAWIWNDLPKGKSLAKAEGKRVLLYFWAGW